MKVVGVILAGGKSSRMGKNKALLPIDGKPNIVRIYEVLEKVVDEMMIITNEPELYSEFHCPLIPDIYKEVGPLGGLHTALSHSSSEYHLVVACDMPFVSKRVLELLIAGKEDFDAVVPSIKGRLHPLLGLYRKTLQAEVVQCIQEKNLKMTRLLDRVNTKVLIMEDLLPEEEWEFVAFNMNTQEDYWFAKQQQEEKRKEGLQG